MLTPDGPTRLWLYTLPDGCIKSWTNFCDRFTPYFNSRKKQPITIVALNFVMQGTKESLRSYIDQFTQVAIEVKGTE